MTKFLPNETAYCRFTGEAFTVASCDGVIAVLHWASDPDGETSTRLIGEITRERLDAQDDEIGPDERAEIFGTDPAEEWRSEQEYCDRAAGRS